MNKITISTIIILTLSFLNLRVYAQLHSEPSCGQNFNLNWSTSSADDDHYWPPGQLSKSYTNVNGSGTDVTITFTGETESLGFWAGNTPKVGTQSSNLFKGIDLLSKGFNGSGITCTITFSKPIYALSFDVHHINKWQLNGDKYTFTGKDKDGNTIYPEFTNSQNPSYTSDNTTGVVNAISNKISGDNGVVGVNFSDSNHIKSISFLWEDCDTCNNNEIHATGIGNFSFCTPQVLDFDGKDDYISSDAFLGDHSEVTMMSWIKLDENSNGGDIIGQRNFRLYVDADKNLKAFIKLNSGPSISSSNSIASVLKENLWQHVALKFNSTTGSVTLYRNGIIIWNYIDSALIGNAINNSLGWNSNHDFEIGRNTEFDNNYFKGSIYECRVYNKALSDTQLQQQLHQEIENNNGYVRGTVVPKNIEGLLWDDLILYYKMKHVDTGYVSDKSNNTTNGMLHNMSIDQDPQDFTAPLPYETIASSNGNWTLPNNWLHGNVWDITKGIPEHSIIEVNGNFNVYSNINTKALIINKNGILNVKQNSSLTNSWYLKLDGNLYLEDQSQLIQTETSTLDKSSNGVLEKDLKGTADKFTYNYWSSPVGKSNNSTLNNSYTVKDVFINIDFLPNGYDGLFAPLSIADYWIWKYSNNLSDNYATWQHVRSSGEIFPGEGFTMKGPGTGDVDDEQSYKLKGKPNNGDITLKVNARNDYLVGNPYPSAIDAVKFIQDNKSIISGSGAINGTLYFWKHWGGGSHIADDYQGGYATFSLSGGVPAASNGNNSDIVSTGGNPIDIPNRYIPVGQGFYITTDTDGAIMFNNSQRISHVKNNTPAHKNQSSKNTASKSDDVRMKIRLGFKSINTLQRQLLITVDENATSGYDWGYDSKYIDTQIDDMYWLINNEKFIIQGTNKIDKQTIIPLGVHTKKDGFNTINIDDLEHVPSEFEIYLHDKELNIYHDLKQSKYETYLAAGHYLERFEIAFSRAQTLGINDNENKQIEVYFSNEKNRIVVNNPTSKLIESVEMFNILGQALFKFQTNTSENHLEYSANQITTGNYILKIETEFGLISKKVLIK